MDNISVVIVEDDDLIREGMANIIDEQSGYRCSGSFSNGEALLEKINLINPKIVLMDIGLPGMNGIECLRQIRQNSQNILVIMLTVFEDDERVFESIIAGADGYLLKKTTPPKIIDALNDVLNGGAPMSNQIAKRVLDNFRMTPGIDETQSLSKREKEILDLLSKGFTHKQIAENIFISPETVRGHLKNIYKKLQVHSKTEAVSKAFQLKKLFR
ncbi:MAG: response regulator transcription factor [Ignavibacteriaceae bacterium]